MRAVDVSAVKTPSRNPDSEKALQWWRKARFGLFIHWSLSSIKAGEWKGEVVPGLAEWMMFQKKIPVAEFAPLAQEFNPRKFDAAAWAQLAVDAGMRYVVITAKHHEGFAMYHSKADPYNVVDATPWGRDPLKELAKECRKRRLKLCFYYSQDLDWHHPDGAWNTWDYDEAKKKPERYLREKVFPQLRELLTQYGSIGMIWFDTPLTLSRAQSRRIRKFVKDLQPQCLVSGRIGHGLGDYSLPRDNFLPGARLEGDWETCATMNDTWGYKRTDHAWKPVDNLITTLVDLASKGSNYLLNVGPDADGVVPAPSVKRLHQMGAWMAVNGEAIRGTTPSPFKPEFSWGRMTTKGRSLFLHFFGRPERRFRLHGLKTKVRSAALLAAPEVKFAVTQSVDPATGTPLLDIDFKGFKSTRPVTVVKLQLAAAPEVEERTMQQPDDSITLVGPQAQVGTDRSESGAAAKPAMRMGGNGLTENWANTEDWLEWDFVVLKPGTYDAMVVTTHQHLEPWSGGHTVVVSCAGKQLRRRTKQAVALPGLRSKYYPQWGTPCGKLRFAEAGVYTLRLQIERLNVKAGDKTLFSDGGMQFSELRLAPA
ncbi:alpha-L-fucosidase [Actomonas aquatica]|uniref:alpha-L-fucosidase n=1 Tax=Actomonas aquatica TaxID=2866162 RepID=A0ABZ1C511_9BACT|nr:alpha-L-fucosidase [Opitutus sp. WL0086]WRQ86418.1 alpha-L-fucosidase [Opitutus sp. WL0086]